jgi:SSS family solute:Na+ symporter
LAEKWLYLHSEIHWIYFTRHFRAIYFGHVWKRTTGAAAVAGILVGFGVSVVFNNYAVNWFGHDTLLYTAFEVINTTHLIVLQHSWEIPF